MLSPNITLQLFLFVNLMSTKIFIIAVLLGLTLIFNKAVAQNATDSLISVLAKLPSDTSFVNLSNKIAKELYDKDTEKALSYSQQALLLAQKLNYDFGIATAKINIGWIYYRKGEIGKAFEQSSAALVIIEKLGNDILRAEVLTNIAAIYNEQEKYNLSIDYFNRALLINQKLENSQGIGRCLNNLGYTSFKLKNYTIAKEFVDKSIIHNQKIGNKYYLGFAIRTKGDILYAQKIYDEALQNWEKAIKIAQEIKNNVFWTTCLNRIARANIDKKEFSNALVVLNQAIEIAQKFGFRSDLRQSYQLIAQAYNGLKAFEKALHYHEKFFALHDSLYNEANSKKINQLQSYFENEKKEKEIILLKAEQAQNQILNDKKAQQQFWGIFSAFMTIFTISTIALLIFRSRKKIQKAFGKLEKANIEIVEKNEEISQQKEEILQTLETLEEQRNEIQVKNENIIASINYAFRIQNAILPPISKIQQYFPESFIFYRPKDIVSGDFYWFAEKENTQIIAVADCTGHGVSGAFMTMIGNNILNQIVHDQEIYAPNEILNLMPILLEKALSNSEGKVKDGMDISIITIYKSENITKIEYAGAMSPLYYVKNQEFREIKADKIPIGGKIKEGFTYKKHEIIVDSTCTFYLFSDGFQDQFGGKENKKFMLGNFRNKISEIAGETMFEQEKLLAQTFKNWQGREKQTDDVLVLGIRI